MEIRLQGRLARLPAEALDFNRYGIAVLTEIPLKLHKAVYLTLRWGELRLDNLAGVVHNCCKHNQRFRCGIRFRVHAVLQTDRPVVEAMLTSMEALAPDQSSMRPRASSSSAM